MAQILGPCLEGLGRLTHPLAKLGKSLPEVYKSCPGGMNGTDSVVLCVAAPGGVLAERLGEVVSPYGARPLAIILHDGQNRLRRLPLGDR